MDTQLLNNKNSVMLNEVLLGLNQKPKTLPCKYFYDEKGSKIFEQLIELEEYYLVRTEALIMKEYALEIAGSLGEDCLIFELGCGSNTRISLLFGKLRSPAAYIPIDISNKALKKNINILENEFPNLKIIPICGDYTKKIEFPEFELKYSKRVVYSPGSNIGNFNRSELNKIFKIIHKLCGKNGSLLIGIDLKKDKAVLENAYNDKKGVHVLFNLNILSHINNSLGSNFNLNNFEHKAIYNEKEGQIEMRLYSKTDQEVQIGNETILFIKEEYIITEVCCKYTIKEFEELIKDFFIVEKVWTDKDNKFAVLFLNVK